MLTQEAYIDVAQQAVANTVRDFHFRVRLNSGAPMFVPFSYQIEKPGYHPFQAGKAAPHELRAEFDHILDTSNFGQEMDSIDSARRVALLNGLGVDCSNFAYRAMERIHDEMGLTPYAKTVFRSGQEIRDLHATKKPAWDAKDETGQVRDLSTDEQAILEDSDLLDVAWLTEVFCKDSELFITGAKHICAPEATVLVEPNEVLPGDLLSFTKADEAVVSHVAVVERVAVENGETNADFWHSWDSHDFKDGIRCDSLTVVEGMVMYLTADGLGDPARYSGLSFRRPRAMAVAYQKAEA